VLQTGLPKARTNGLLFRQVDHELLVHDIDAGSTFCLDDASARILKHCDGSLTVDALLSRVQKEFDGGFQEDALWVTLEELRRRNLLDEGSLSPTKFEGMSRRAMLKRIGASAAIMAPVIMSVTATPLFAQSIVCGCAPINAGLNNSAPGCPCVGNNDCCAVCGGSEENPICGGNVKPTPPPCCVGLICPPFNAGTNDAPPGCPCQGNNDCCAVCGGSVENPICGGNVKPGAPPSCF
jgi:hypothetical protein